MSDRIPENFAEVHFVIHLATDPEEMITSLGIRTDPASITPAIIDDFLTAFEDVWLPDVTEDYTWGPHRVEVGTSGDANYELVFPGTRVGERTSVPTPQNTSYLVQKRGMVSGRRGRGRMYVPGVPNTHVLANGTLDAAVYGDISDRLADFNDAYTPAAEGIDSLALFHNRVLVDPGPPPVYEDPPDWTPADIGALILQTAVATQRRRLRP